MKVTRLMVMAAALSFASAMPAFAADKDADKERIAADAKAAKAKCKDMKGNAKDICMAEANGQEKVAKAELALKNKDTPKNRYDVAAAKADADHGVAREKCDDMKGKEKEACQKDAKNARDAAKKTAKAEREAAEPKGKKEPKAPKEAK